MRVHLPKKEKNSLTLSYRLKLKTLLSNITLSTLSLLHLTYIYIYPSGTANRFQPPVDKATR